MNNKGFTTIELILTMLLVVIIMATITNVTYVYRDRSDYEQTYTDIVNYKNSLTRIIYDDILNTADPVVSINKQTDYYYELVTRNNVRIPLKIVIDTKDTTTNKYTTYIEYNNIIYEIPGSSDRLITLDITNTKYESDTTNGMYSLDIIFHHRNLENDFRIHFVVT